MPRGGHGGISIGEVGGHGSNNSGNHTGDRSSFSSRGLGDVRGGKSAFHGSGDNRENREKTTRDRDREMVGGCCVCSDERGWDENPLVYCDGHGCNVAVHQACYGIVSVPTGPWFCRKCESQERAARVRCELCPNKDGGLKRTDTNSWAHVVCALYIPEVRFGNVSTMEPIVLGLVPQERYLKVCYLCEQQGRESRASSGACMQCNKSGCKQSFHVTCAQRAGLLCEEAGNYMDNVKYCGYCEYHYQRINKKFVKTVPAYRPSSSSNSVFDRISDDERNSPRSTSSPDQKRGNLESEFVNSTSNHAATKNMNNSSASLNCSTSSSNLSSSLGGGLLSSSSNDGKGDRGGGDSSSVVSSSSSSSKKGKKGRKPNSEKGSSGSNEGKIEPLKISSESLNSTDTPSTTSGQTKTEKGDSTENKNDLNTNKLSNNHSNIGASSSNSKTNDSSSSPIQNSKDLSTNSSVHGNSQNSTSTHNQLKDEAAKRSSPSLATSGISSKPSSELTSDSTTNGNSISSTNSKPPSVIVKFGKQDGTYYSKKDPVTSQSTSNSSSSAITTSSIAQPPCGSSNNSNASDNSNSHDLTNKTSSLSSQSYNHKDHRHGKKHSFSSSKGSRKDHSTSSTDSSALVSNNGLDNSFPKKEGAATTNGPVDFTTAHKAEQQASSKLSSTNDKHSLEDSSDPYKKGFTSANFTESKVTPTSSVGATLFTKDSLPKSQPHQVSGSNYQDKESNHGRMHNSHSSDRRHFPQSSTGASSISSDRYSHGNSVTTSVVKSEPMEFGKNHDSFAASTSRSTTNNTSTHQLDKNTLQDKPNADLKITKYGVHDTSNGKSSQAYSSYNKLSYEPSSVRGERSTSSSVTVSKSTHHVPEQKKDSPAKILPISASTSPEKSRSGESTPSFGRPLKVEVSSGNASRSSSLEVSPVKRADDTSRKDLSPSKLSKEYGPKQSSKSSSGKRLGRPPKKGTHLNVNSLGHLASGSSANATSTEANIRKRSPQSSPERDSEEFKKRRKRSPSKRMTNGQRDSSDRSSRDRLWMMMGATLNPNSSMADEMENVLKHEVRDHSVYDSSMQPNYHQVPLPGGKRSLAAKSSSALVIANASTTDGKSKDQPQTLDELLERQWEQGSQFLMEQASHFDIASLLSSLHQLKEENIDLEDSVDRMVQRRDHLLAVRARLLALSSLTVATPNNTGSQIGGSGSNQTTPERERYTAAVAHQTGQSPITGTTVVNVGVSNGPSPSSGRSSAHVSPRNSAATISPIRPGGGNALISPRAPPNLPPPPSSQVQMPPSIERSHNIPSSSSNSSASIYMQPPPAHSPRDRINRPPSGGPLGIAPPSHQVHGAPSPRDRPTSSPRHLTSPHSRDSRMSPRVPSSTTIIHSGSAPHSSMPIENGVDYPHRGHHPGALPPPPHGAIPVSSPAPNLPPGTMIHPRDPAGHSDLGPPPQPRSSGPVSSSHLLSVASHPPSGRGVSINTTGSSGPPHGGVVVCSSYGIPQNSTSPSVPPPRQSSMSYATSSGNIPGGPHGQHPAHMPPRSSPHHPPPPGANIHPSQRGPPPHIPSSLGGGATTIMTAVSSSIGPPHSSGLPPVPPRSTGGMMIRPMGSHPGPAGSGMGSSYRPGGPTRNYHGMPSGPHGPPPPGHMGGPSRSPTPMNAQHASMRAQQGRMLGPPGGMMNIHPQDKR